MQTFYAWWQSRRLRPRVAQLVAQLATLKSELHAERSHREREDAAIKVALQWLGERCREQMALALDHRAWTSALVETAKSNAGRYRELTRLHAARVRAMQKAAAAAPETAAVSNTAAPLAAEGD